MEKWNSETEARDQIKQMVGEYYHEFKEKKEPFHPGERISYASRVFDGVQNLDTLVQLLDTHK